MKEVWDLKVIQFETNGGSPTPSKQHVLKFELIEKPANPTKTNYDFAGWYVDNDTFEIPWDFNKIPAVDLTLYAKWVATGGSGTPVCGTCGEDHCVCVPDAVNAQMPTITTHPQGGTYNALIPITLTTAASTSDGGTLTYRWYKNTANSNTGGTFITETTSPNFAAAIGQAPRDMVGTFYYYVVVTNTITDNYDGGNKVVSVTSNQTAITVNGNFNVTTTALWNETLNIIQKSGNDQNYTINTGSNNIDGITPLTGALTNTTGFGTGTDLTITLTGSGTFNTANATGNMLRVGGGQELIIDGGITLNGRRNGQNGHTGDNDMSVIVVQTDGTLRLKNGTITGNNRTGNSAGGVVINPNGASFIMEGGVISGNESAGVAGGVIVNSNSTFTMSNGTISGNTAGTSGGGITVSTGATFTMTGGEITGNIASTSGGGVSVLGTFNMTGGIITSNIARERGGGITVNQDATFTKTGNSIITGFGSDTVNGNVVRNTSDVVLPDMGHAIFRVNGSRREKTVGINDDLGFIGGVETGNWIDP